MDASTPPDSTSETASINSEESAAIVSLYNSWSSASECNSLLPDDDGLQSVDGFSALPGMHMKPAELLSNLRKRCREEDIPQVPKLRQRRAPTCAFLNYFGHTRVPPMPQQHERPPTTIGLDFGFEEFDLFPLCPKKARHDDSSSKGSSASTTESS